MCLSVLLQKMILNTTDIIEQLGDGQTNVHRATQDQLCKLDIWAPFSVIKNKQLSAKFVLSYS